MAPPRTRKRKKNTSEPTSWPAQTHKTPNNPRPTKQLKLPMRKGGAAVGRSVNNAARLKVMSSSTNEPKSRNSESQDEDSVQSVSSANQRTVSPIENLSDDTLGTIFFSGYVNSLDILTNVTMVSKRTRQVAHKSVKMLDLRALVKLEAQDVATIVSRHGHVSSIDFGYCPQFAREHLMALVPLAETLRCLYLRGTSVKGEDVVAYLDAVTERLGGKPSGLEELDLSCIKKEESNRIGDEAVSKIAHCCPNLKSLHLGWCKGVSDKSIPDLKNLRRLKGLDLSLTSVTEESCKHLANIFELEKLDLSATGIGNDGIQDLVAQDPKQLVRLHLRELKLSFNAQMTEDSLSLLASHMPSLERLDIRYCNIEKSDFKELFRDLEQNGTKIEGGGA